LASIQTLASPTSRRSSSASNAVDDLGAEAPETRETQQAVWNRLRSLLLIFAELGSDLVGAFDAEACLTECGLYGRAVEVARHVAEGLVDGFGFVRFQARGCEDGVDKCRAAGLQHSRDLSKAACQVRDYFEHVAAPDHIHAVIGLIHLLHDAASDLDSLAKTRGGHCSPSSLEVSVDRIDADAAATWPLDEWDQVPRISAPDIEQLAVRRQ
jgi:hypothetical protein